MGGFSKFFDSFDAYLILLYEDILLSYAFTFSKCLARFYDFLASNADSDLLIGSDYLLNPPDFITKLGF